MIRFFCVWHLKSTTKKYRNDIPRFLKYIKESDFAVGPDYKETWEYITEKLHSLERHTNLEACFEISENGDLLEEKDE